MEGIGRSGGGIFSLGRIDASVAIKDLSTPVWTTHSRCIAKNQVQGNDGKPGKPRGGKQQENEGVVVVPCVGHGVTVERCVGGVVERSGCSFLGQGR